jgi:hypothetical protein
MGRFRVKNFESFQRYKDREPTWIMLHRTLLRDYEFASLPDEAKAHLILIWLLASQQKDRTLPDDPRWIASQIGARKPVDLKPFFEQGWLIPVAGSEQIDTQPYQDDTEIPHSRAGARSVSGSSPSGSVSGSSPEGEHEGKPFAAFWEIYPRKDGKQKAEESWSKLKLEDQVLALADVPLRAAANWAGREIDKIPYAATYLNQKTWRDEIQAHASRGAQLQLNAPIERLKAKIVAAEQERRVDGET